MNGHLLCGTPIRVSKAKVPSQKPQYRPKQYQYNSPRNILDILPDRDTGVEEENYGHIGQDNSISSRDLVSYDEV